MLLREMVLKLRSALVIAMIWLATVAGVSATAWVAIDRAGRDISGADASPPVTPSLGPSVATPTPTPASASTSTQSTSEPSAPTSTRTTSSPTTSSTAPPPSRSTQAAPRSPTPQDRTVIVRGGRVTVRCTGADITIRIAQPDDGWRVEVARGGAGEVGVSFKRGGNESTGSTHVQAVCSAGTPVFKVVAGSD